MSTYLKTVVFGVCLLFLFSCSKNEFDGILPVEEHEENLNTEAGNRVIIDIVTIGGSDDPKEDSPTFNDPIKGYVPSINGPNQGVVYDTQHFNVEFPTKFK